MPSIVAREHLTISSQLDRTALRDSFVRANTVRVAVEAEATMNLPSYAMKQSTFPEMYERQLVGPLFRPWAEMIVEEVKLSPGERVLDIACGTGIVARLANDRLARVVGVDLSPDMLEVARGLAPAIDWRVGAAAALPLRDGERFDVVVCQQGLQFFPDKSAAAAEMRRALGTGGRLAIAIWRSDEEIPFFLALRRVAERHLGTIADQRYGFGDGASLEALLHDAGFLEVHRRIVSRAIRFTDGASFVRMNSMAFVGMSANGKAMTDQERKQVVDAIVSDSAPVLEQYTDASGLAFNLSTNLATARG
jgi:ubiquinone/menaquinone biosynthesis C-methylase UbiE